MEARLGTADDAHAVVETIALAFMRDPVWSWAMPDAERRAEQFRAWWPLSVAGPLAQEAVWVVDSEAAAVAVWIPPGGSEMSAEDAARVEPLLRELLGGRQAELVLELNQSFEAHHPEGRFHYLSLLGTHPDHRGRGLGIGLLARRLKELDALGEASVLESTNPANHARYMRLGYAAIDEWNAPAGGPPVLVMRRDPR